MYNNTQTNSLGTALSIAFSQVAESKKVRKHMLKGKDIATKHIKVFDSYLEMASLPKPMAYDQEVTESNESPFSDKLMMFLFSMMIYTGIGNYGVSMSKSERSDLVVDYSRLTAEILKFSEDGINIMISNEWLEQQPLSANRKDLAKD